MGRYEPQTTRRLLALNLISNSVIYITVTHITIKYKYEIL